MNDEDLRDLFAGFAMVGLIQHFDFDSFKQDPQRVARWSYDAADAMIEAKREKKEIPEGIASVVKKRKPKTEA
jgi:hypothetical protein